MKYVSIDVETLGTDQKTCDMVEFAAVLDDLAVVKPVEELPRFHPYLLSRNGNYHGQAVPFSWHAEIFKNIAICEKVAQVGLLDRATAPEFCYIDELGQELAAFFKVNGVKGKITPAGKQFGSFDLDFLKEVPCFQEHVGLERTGSKAEVIIARRSIDPAIVFWKSEDNLLPDTNNCMQRSGIIGSTNHTALQDAITVVHLVRKAASILWS